MHLDPALRLHESSGRVRVDVEPASGAASSGRAALDPLALHSDLNTPYPFFGITPTLFDAPYRDVDHPVVWQARSYLAASSGGVLAKEARPVVAFSWGFRIEARAVTLQTPAPLDVARWTEHLEVLEDAHPGWNLRS